MIPVHVAAVKSSRSAASIEDLSRLLPCLLKEDTPRADTIGGFSDLQHLILPFVLRFIPAVTLATCALPLIAGAWAAVAQAATWTRFPLSTGTSVYQRRGE